MYFISFYHEEISGVVGRKSEQCLAQAESIWNAIGQWGSSNKKSPLSMTLALSWNPIGPPLSGFGS